MAYRRIIWAKWKRSGSLLPRFTRSGGPGSEGYWEFRKKGSPRMSGILDDSFLST